jgi:hypothetical protein
LFITKHRLCDESKSGRGRHGGAPRLLCLQPAFEQDDELAHGRDEGTQAFDAQSVQCSSEPFVTSRWVLF